MRRLAMPREARSAASAFVRSPAPSMSSAKPCSSSTARPSQPASGVAQAPFSSGVMVTLRSAARRGPATSSSNAMSRVPR